MGSFSQCMQLIAELVALAAICLGAFVAFGPCQDGRTWNLRRDSAKNVEVDVPSVGPTHFRLRQVIPTHMYDAWERSPEAWLRKAPPVLFLPGHMGKWTQVINIASYLNAGSAPGRIKHAAFFAVDFHASASALHASIIKQQAAFAAAAADRIVQLYRDAGRPGIPLTIVAHSMGGVVAQEALYMLSQRGSGTRLQAMLLICSPVLGHPLVVEPRSALLIERSRRHFWGEGGLAPWTLAIAAGDTDPLVPSEVAALPSRAVGDSVLTTSMHGIHASFSHVNLLFSRPSLHVISGLVAAAVAGELPRAAKELRSPLSTLFERSHLGAEATSTSYEANLSSSLLALPDKEKGIVTMAPFSFDAMLQFQSHRLPLDALPYSRLQQGKLHVIPQPHGSEVFTFVLFEEPRKIRREIEKTSRGEDFDEKDRLDCGALVRLQAATFVSLDNVELQIVEPVIAHYPLKICIFQYRIPPQTPSGSAQAVLIERYKLEKSKGKKLKMIGWAQWHLDPLGSAEGGESRAGIAVPTGLDSIWSWLSAISSPRRVSLPAGHAVVSQVARPLGSALPFLPIDICIAAGSTTPWGLHAVLLASDGKGAHVAAVRTSSEHRWLGWAAESDPGVFAPRFSPGQIEIAFEAMSKNLSFKDLKSPTLLVISDPTVEMLIDIHPNVWAALARWFRTYLGYFLAAWFGATLIVPLGLERPLECLFTWIVFSTFMTTMVAEGPGRSADGGYSPGSPPFVLLVGIHVLGGALALNCRRGASWMMLLWRRCSNCFCSCFSLPLLLDLLIWLSAAGLHPAACVVGMNIRAACLLSSRNHAARANKVTMGSEPHLKSKHSDADGWLSGLAALLFLYLFCYLPSTILTCWILNGQHREASTSEANQQLQADLPTSSHAVVPWIDSFFMERRLELRELIELPFIGLGLPALALALHAACSRGDANCDLAGLLSTTVGTSPPMSTSGFSLMSLVSLLRLTLMLLAVTAAPLVGHRPHRLWFVFQPAFLVHMLVPAGACIKMKTRQRAAPGKDE